MTSELVSWLTLERYALDELPPLEMARVERALTESGELQQCLERIRAQAHRSLKPLPAAPAAQPRLFPWVWRPIQALAFAGTIVLVVVGAWRWSQRASDSAALQGIKGGGFVVSLLRQSNGAPAADSSVFVQGDEFEVAVTCSATGLQRWQVAVFQGETVAFPLEESKGLSCGNQVVLPGAFRVSGTQAVLVCLSVGSDVVDPAVVRSQGVKALKSTSSCAHIRPLQDR